MSIISIDEFRKELDEDTTDYNKLLTKSVNRATSFVHTYTAMHHMPFDDFNATTGFPRAPDDIVNYCTQVATAMFYMSIGESSRDGKERTFWKDILIELSNELKKLRISSKWITETISVDSNDIMLLGADINNHQTYKVIPFNANITGGASTWVNGTDFVIVTGEFLNGLTNVEYLRDVWYLYGLENTTVDGTLHYMRSFRNDNSDYALYSRNN
jgi:hypothetical protein